MTGIVNNLDNTKNKSYTYDNLNRLATASGPWGSLSWTLDPVGNSQTQVDGSGTSSYTYSSGSNRLSGITGANPASFSSDANGNTISENAKIFTYNQNQRLIQAAATQTGNYVYNANGQRVKKTVGGAVTVFHYDQNGQLIAESSASGAMQVEYVYLNGIPLAKIDGSGTQYIHTDHLGTPVMMTDATGAKVWEIENRPFGDGATVTGTASLNLRFPGQYFDAESGLNYNYFRDYNPVVGRYIEADPIGLDGGVNLFGYVQANPVSLVDPSGLNPARPQYRYVHPEYNAFVEVEARMMINAIREIEPNYREPDTIRAPGSPRYNRNDVEHFRIYYRMLRSKTGQSCASDGAEKIGAWLGKGAKLKVNSAGDLVFVSRDGNRRVRFDINRPYPHENPHGHVEEIINGQWVTSGQIYPIDVPHK